MNDTQEHSEHTAAPDVATPDLASGTMDGHAVPQSSDQATPLSPSGPRHDMPSGSGDLSAEEIQAILAQIGAAGAAGMALAGKGGAAPMDSVPMGAAPPLPGGASPGMAAMMAAGGLSGPPMDQGGDMPREHDPSVILLKILDMEHHLRKIGNKKEFAFFVANHTHDVMPYDQAVFFEQAFRKIKITTISGLVEADERSEVYGWFLKVLDALVTHEDALKVRLLSAQDMPKELEEKWADYIEPFAMWVPFVIGSGLCAGLFLTRAAPFTEQDEKTMALVQRPYVATFNDFLQKESRLKKGIIHFIRTKLFRWTLVGIMMAVQFIPVRQSIVVPAEIVPGDAIIMTSPMNGIISKVFIKPNDIVKKGDILFALDDITVTNQKDVVEKALAVAEAEYESAAKKAFSDAQSKASLAVLKARIQEKRTELDYQTALLEKIKVRAEKDGVAVFNSVEDFLGKSVSGGQKIMMIADPKTVEIEMWVPVDNVIPFEKDAEVQAFLNINPLHMIRGKLSYYSYEARTSPKSVLAYRVRATLDNQSALPRIGLEGSGKVFGPRTSLFYHMMRRPIAVIRKFLGI